MHRVSRFPGLQARLQTDLQAVLKFGFLLLVLGISAPARSAEPTRSAEPALRDLMPDNWVVRIEAQRPAAVFNHPLVRDLTELIESSPAYRIEQSAVERERLLQGYQFLEQTLGTSWKEGLDRLTAGGLCLSVTLPDKPGGQPGYHAVLQAKDAETLSSLLKALHERLAKDLPQAKPQPRKYAGIDGYQLATLHYVVHDESLFFAGQADHLESMLRKALSSKTATPADAPKTDALKTDARLKVSINLDRVRTVPDALKIDRPAKDLGQVILAGGYLDLLRKAHKVEAELVFSGDSIELTVEADAGSSALSPGLQGFFGNADTAPAALLQLPGTIASASWVRDYAPFWNHRQELATTAALAEVEEQHKALTARNGFGPFDLFQHLGPRWRTVVARQTENVYRRRPSQLLPAAAIVAEVRNDAKFQTPIYDYLKRESRGILTLVFGYAKNADYKGATVISVRLKEPESQPEPSDFRYSLNPAMSFTRGVFIAGTTEQIVKQTIDELDRQAALAPAESSALGLAQLGESVVDVQQYSLRELGTAVAELRESLVKQAILERGLIFSEAELEVNLFNRLLARLDRITSATQVSPERFRYVLKAGR